MLRLNPRRNNLLLCHHLLFEQFILMRDVNEMKIDIEFCPMPPWIVSRTMHYSVGHGERRNPRWRHLGKFYVRSQPRTETCQVREQSYHETVDKLVDYFSISRKRIFNFHNHRVFLSSAILYSIILLYTFLIESSNINFFLIIINSVIKIYNFITLFSYTILF